VADLGMQAAFAAVRPGVTCGDVIAEGTAVMLREGAESAAMVPASGVGTQYLDSAEDPRRVIGAGDMVFIDMGIWVHGYLGDMTRSAIVGEGTPEQRQLLETVQDAYRLASQAMVPGADTAEIYQSVVDHYAARGWDRYFVHHIGHGLGLGGDLPRCARGVSYTLQAGDALSCEPGCYVPGMGGARVEDMIYVSENGPESLTKTPIDPILGT
jgi:Xaa-Pro aminopeptidase